MLYGTHTSAHSDDFCKPVTVAALELFDPDLKLVWNNQFETFQVLRWRIAERTFWLDGFGWLTFLEDYLIHVTDWKEGLEGRDDPDPLIGRLWESDLQRNPNLERDRLQAILTNRLKAREKVRDNYRHATRENRRQLLRAYEPLVHFPNTVR